MVVSSPTAIPLIPLPRLGQLHMIHLSLTSRNGTWIQILHPPEIHLESSSKWKRILPPLLGILSTPLESMASGVHRLSKTSIGSSRSLPNLWPRISRSQILIQGFPQSSSIGLVCKKYFFLSFFLQLFWCTVN